MVRRLVVVDGVCLENIDAYSIYTIDRSDGPRTITSNTIGSPKDGREIFNAY
jgi:hypothetical protein